MRWDLIDKNRAVFLWWLDHRSSGVKGRVTGESPFWEIFSNPWELDYLDAVVINDALVEERIADVEGKDIEVCVLWDGVLREWEAKPKEEPFNPGLEYRVKPER